MKRMKPIERLLVVSEDGQEVTSVLYNLRDRPRIEVLAKLTQGRRVARVRIEEVEMERQVMLDGREWNEQPENIQ